MSTTSTSEAPLTSTEGPVLSLINKRIRALRKKQNRILQMEESLSQGKVLNKEQQETLRSKPGVVALIDELEKFRAPLSAAVEEEVSLALERHKQKGQPLSDPNSAGGSGDAAAAAEEVEAAAPTVSDGDRGGDAMEDLLNLLYFGSLFDVMPQSDFTSMMLTRTHERNCCLTYDYVTDDATDLLGERDLDLIAALKGLMISRPLSSSLSHKNALQRCIEHAKLWLANSDQPIGPETTVTYGGLREKLSKILSSDYYTTTPEMRGSVEMAAAAGVASFGSFQVPIHGSVLPASMPVPVEESIGQYQEEEQNVKHEQYETTGQQQSAPVEEHHKDSAEGENTTQEVAYEPEQEITQAEAEQLNRDLDSKANQQEYGGGRRPYQNNRGGRGGRRGYSNGRGGRGSGRGGGGPYQNGRGQYYEQGGSYYPRNNNNNYRGRGGGRGGNSYYNNYNQASGLQGGGAQPQSNVGSA